MVADATKVERGRGGQSGGTDCDGGDGPCGEVVVDSVETGEEASGFVKPGVDFRSVVD